MVIIDLLWFIKILLQSGTTDQMRIIIVKLGQQTEPTISHRHVHQRVTRIRNYTLGIDHVFVHRYQQTETKHSLSLRVYHHQHQQFIQKYRLDGMCVELLLLILLLSVQSKLIDSYVQIPIGLHKSCRLLLNTSATANATQPNIPRSNRPPKIDPHWIQTNQRVGWHALVCSVLVGTRGSEEEWQFVLNLAKLKILYIFE